MIANVHAQAPTTLVQFQRAGAQKYTSPHSVRMAFLPVRCCFGLSSKKTGACSSYEVFVNGLDLSYRNTGRAATQCIAKQLAARRI